MIVCGLKLTHDGSVALLDGDDLVFSVEAEKLGNAARHSTIYDTLLIPEILARFGYTPADVDRWVIDGWNGRDTAVIGLRNGDRPLELRVAPYREGGSVAGVLDVGARGRLPIGPESYGYTSRTHAAGHLAAAYRTSPFAAAGEPAFVLVWDGGMFPRLYHVDPATGVDESVAVFPVVGGVYATAAHHFGPYRRAEEPDRVVDLSVAGKLMAYIGLGKPQPEVEDVLATAFDAHFTGGGERALAYRRAVGGWGIPVDPSLGHLHAFYRDVRARTRDFCDEDILATVHRFLGALLVRRLTEAVERWKGAGPWNLCLVGGCALNIKWNSAVRAQPRFAAVWVPPFPNDSGSALGAAAAHTMSAGSFSAVNWHTRLGPPLGAPPHEHAGWTARPCTPQELGRLLHTTGEPVVVLDGRAELGPRALGGRSILAPATRAATKDLLNRVKGREYFRPVAPICLEEHAPAVFDPGTPDPHMLFDHDVRADWVRRIPAVLHVDGTARLQTVRADEDTATARILGAYHRASGIPVLCNTSANGRGRGFFPDVASALDWGRVDTVWSRGVLYRRDPRRATG